MPETETTAPVETTPPPRKPERSRTINRVGIGANVILQIVLFTLIIGGVNYVAFKNKPLRWDLSRNSKFQLSPMTRNLLKELQKPVTMIVFTAGSAIQNDLTSLLREYEYAAGKGFQVEYVNPYTNLARAKAIVTQYKLNSAENVVVDYGGKSKVVNIADMAELDTSGEMFGRPATVRSFKGEQLLTSTLLELVEEKPARLLVLTGHGEIALDSEQAKAFKDVAERQNLKVEPVNLSNVDALPADASGLVIFGPKTDFSERDIELLSEYWKKNGRLLMLVGPDEKMPRLTEWLGQLGIKLHGDSVVTTQRVPVRDPQTGEIQLATGVVISPPGKYEAGPLTKGLESTNALFLGRTQSLEIDDAKTHIQNLKAFVLINSVEGFWGDAEFTGDLRQPVTFDESKDRKGPFPLAVAAEKGAINDPNVKVDTARLVVVGNAGWLTNEGLEHAPTGEDFAVNAINWLLKREQLVGIAPKPKEPVRLALEDYQLVRLVAAIFLIVPGLVALLGVNVWGRRSDFNPILINVVLLGSLAAVIAVFKFSGWLLHRFGSHIS
jgi:hypothetical protein